jgi:amino acid transporter
VIFGFLGTGSTAVATFEAKHQRGIVIPALWVHWVVYFLYTFLTLAIVVTVPWDDNRLGNIFGDTISRMIRRDDNFAEGLSPVQTESPSVI